MSDAGVYRREREEWDRNALFYEREVRSPFFMELTREKAACYGDEPFCDKVVVDMGGGNGFFLDYMRKKCSFLSVTADLSLQMLISGRRLSTDRDHYFINAVAESFPFKSRSVDTVVLNGALHHFKAAGILEKAVEEPDRVLKKGGCACVYDRNGSLASRLFHSIAIGGKKAVETVIGQFPSSSTGSEPDFNDHDLSLFVRRGYGIRRRVYVSSVPFFSMLVFCNFVEYTLGHWPSELFRALLMPFARLCERALAFRCCTIEQCIVLQKTQSGGGA